jgi:predicted lipoprotein with Yx(FWY)xxD motif
MKRMLIPGAALAAALALAACGGSSSTSGSTTPSAASHTVGVKSIDGVGNVLVDAHGMPLYSSNLDARGTPACDGACTAIWKPLTASGAPSAADGAGAVGVVMRSDGTRQVAIAGRPLYTFVKDSPGKVGGNGVADAFAGRRFTWAAVLAGGKSAPAGAKGASTPASGSSGGY